MAIRYDKKLNSEIARVVRNYNAKIKRIENYFDSFNYMLPEKMSIKNLKQNVYTRNELRRKLKELQRYSTRGIEQTMTTKSGYSLSKYEYINLKKETARVKRNITRELTRLESEQPKVFGVKQSKTFAQMGDSYYLNLEARREKLQKDIQALDKVDYESYKQLVYKTGRNMEYNNSLFRENYKKMLTDLAYYVKYDKEMDLDPEIYEKIKRKHNSDEIFKKLELKVTEDESGNKKYTIKKLKYLEYSLDNIKDSNKFYKLFREEKGVSAIVDYYPLITGKGMKKMDPDKIKGDVEALYDNLIDNIDDIIGTL